MKKVIFWVALIIGLFLAFFLIEYQKFSDGKLHLVFCNVGQGDAIFIRTPKGLDFLIDGGPDNSVLECLSSHMPFWDRTIEMIFLTHPHADHMRGLIDVFKRYEVKSFSTEKIYNDTDLYSELIKLVKKEGITIKNVYMEDKFTTKDGVSFKILHPTVNFIKNFAPDGLVNEAAELASLVIHVSYKGNDIILTGDSEITGLKEAFNASMPSIEVFQVPHHGSRYGIDTDIIQRLKPKLAVISVGKNNYGHPSKEILNMLRNLNIKILRTDIEGKIHLTF